MLKYIKTKDAKHNGLLYRCRKVIADEKLLEKLVKVPEAIVYSSWRSLAEQKELFKQGKSKTLYSNHRRGMAVDVINWKDVEKKMNKVGLINDISWDKNHFTLGGESKATKYPIYDELPKDLKEYKKNEPTKVETAKVKQTPTPQPIVQPTSKIEQQEVFYTKDDNGKIEIIEEPTIQNPIPTIRDENLVAFEELEASLQPWYIKLIISILNLWKK